LGKKQREDAKRRELEAKPKQEEEIAKCQKRLSLSEKKEERNLHRINLNSSRTKARGEGEELAGKRESQTRERKKLIIDITERNTFPATAKVPHFRTDPKQEAPREES